MAGQLAESLFWRNFEELTVWELHDVLRLRCRVFIIEQNCPFGDVDGEDPQALHLLASSDGVPGIAGYLRCLPSADGAHVIIGRVVTAPEARASGLGRRLMTEAVAEMRRRFLTLPMALSAQSRLERFYVGLGFQRTSPDYMDDGILHCDMRLDRDG